MKKKKLQKNVNHIDAIEELLKDQSGLGSEQTVFEPSNESVTRLSVIPLLFDEPFGLPVGSGRVAYDSWSQGPRVALRDITDGHIRRVQLEAGKISVEIVAEMNKGKWEFVARVYRNKTVVHDFVMSVGRKKLLSESGGFYRWSSKSVPRNISLTSPAQHLTFERLSW